MSDEYLERYAEISDNLGFDDMGNYFNPPEYHPSPQIVPDTQIGFDMDGNYHVVEARTLLYIAQAVMAEDPNDNAWTRFREVEEQNGLPEGVTADELFTVWQRVYGSSREP